MTFTYIIAPSFNLQGFLTAVRADGIKLHAIAADEIVNGYIEVTAGKMFISLHETTDEAKKVARLEGNLENYKVTLDLRVSQYE